MCHIKVNGHLQHSNQTKLKVWNKRRAEEWLLFQMGWRPDQIATQFSYRALLRSATVWKGSRIGDEGGSGSVINKTSTRDWFTWLRRSPTTGFPVASSQPVKVVLVPESEQPFILESQGPLDPARQGLEPMKPQRPTLPIFCSSLRDSKRGRIYMIVE